MADLVEWDRFIYLDVDVIVRRDLQELYATELNGNPLAGVMHVGGFNAGVLVIDAQTWRTRGLAQKIIEFARMHKPKEGDQDAIIGVLGAEIQHLDPRWNTIVDAIWAPQVLRNPYHLQEAWILHYITGFKPWNLGRFFLPSAYRVVWDAYRPKGPLPRNWRAEIKLLLWQLRILAKRQFK